MRLLPLYRAAAAVADPLAGLFLRWRLARGKEDAARLREKTGLPGRARPEGPVAWLHGASVGEGLALLPLVERLAGRGFAVLVTTGTLSSARVLAQRLGPGAIHQFAPLDVPRFVRRFLDHWRPDLVLFAESEIWPNMLDQAARRRLPLMLVNARLSQRSFARWQILPATIGGLLGGIDLCLAQTAPDAERLRQLGAPRVEVAGNLKYDVAAPPVDNARLALLQAQIGARPVWLAASTHPGEEAIAGAVHRRLAARFPDLLTIIAPRHPERGAAILAALPEARLRSRSGGIDASTGIYIADTMGEMGLLFRLAPVVFVGKSMASAARQSMGGQNPIEPAKLGSAILHGPHVGNFQEVYAALGQAEGALGVGDADALARVLELLLGDAALLRKMARNALDSVGAFGGAADRIMQALDPYILQLQIERR